MPTRFGKSACLMPGRGGDRRHERPGLSLALRPEGLGRRQRSRMKAWS